MPITIGDLKLFERLVERAASSGSRTPVEATSERAELAVLRAYLHAQVAGEPTPPIERLVNGMPVRKMHETLEALRRSVDGPFVEPAEWDDLIRFLDVMFCAHEWEFIAAPLEPHKQVLKCKHCHYIQDVK